ncbi:hypothetical protein [uncultured Clostridium sp.]|uniref:hypothetical protein n=1 Tax=uncultured Clostridium sp. TaxID=59620 RepID=UPI003216A11F
MKSEGWGKGCLPPKYTEDLCKEIFKFKDRIDKSHDAISAKEGKIEVKATIGRSSSTTISSKLEFDHLYWLRFDFENDIVHINVYKRDEVYIYLNNENKMKEERPNITLKKVVNNKNDDHTIVFNKSNNVQTYKFY